MGLIFFELHIKTSPLPDGRQACPSPKGEGRKEEKGQACLSSGRNKVVWHRNCTNLLPHLKSANYENQDNYAAADYFISTGHSRVQGKTSHTLG